MEHASRRGPHLHNPDNRVINNHRNRTTYHVRDYLRMGKLKPKCSKKNNLPNYGMLYADPYLCTCLECYYILRHGSRAGYYEWRSVPLIMKIKEMDNYCDRLRGEHGNKEN